MSTSQTHDIPNPAAPGSPFRPDGVVTLAHVIERVDAEWEGSARRDTLSALRILVTRLDLDADAVTATPPVVRELFEANDRHRLGVSERRYANVRSLVARAIQAFGMRRRRLTTAVALTEEWKALLASVQPREYAQGLKRLAYFGSAAGVTPGEVEVETLRDLHAALVEECIVKNPRAIVPTCFPRSTAGRSRTTPCEPASATPFAGTRASRSARICSGT